MPSQSLPSNASLDRARRTAEAMQRGLSRHQLAGPNVEHPIHGVVAPPGSVDALADRCRAIAVGLPRTHAFSHSTAARIWGLPLPLGLDTSTIHVSVPAGEVVPDHRELKCHGQWLPPEHIWATHSVSCTSPARCFLDLAADIRYDHLVALGDHALRYGLATLEELQSLVDAATRRRGVVGARRALPLLNPLAESPPESICRVWFVEAGLPEVTPQAVIRDNDGRFIARVDLALLEYKVVVEYQGS